MIELLEEFKKFALKGNVMDMAIGVIIGGAFGKIVTSLVNDIVMPVMGLLTGRINVASLELGIRAATADSPGLAIRYGQFLQSSIDFLIVAWSIFLVVRLLNRNRERQKAQEVKAKVAAPPPPSQEEVLLTEIRDLLKRQKDIA